MLSYEINKLKTLMLSYKINSSIHTLTCILLPNAEIYLCRIHKRGFNFPTEFLENVLITLMVYSKVHSGMTWSLLSPTKFQTTTWSLVREDFTCLRATKSPAQQLLSPRAVPTDALEPVSLRPCSTPREALPQQRVTPTCSNSRKPTCCNKDPVQSANKK